MKGESDGRSSKVSNALIKILYILLTAVHPAQSTKWFKQNIDYAVCVGPMPEAHEANSPRGPIALEVDSLSREQCTGAATNAAPAGN